MAGEVLIYLYDRHRKQAFELSNTSLLFKREAESITLPGNDEFPKVLLHAASDSGADAYNILDYLKQKGFLEFSGGKPLSGGVVHLYGFHLTSTGVDIIEDIVRDDGSRQHFNVTFNFNLNNEINVEALVKNEIESLVKASVL